MRIYSLIVLGLLSVVSSLAMADSSAASVTFGSHYSEQSSQSLDGVMMVGAPETPENNARSVVINKVFRANEARMRYCFEKSLMYGDVPRLRATFYFQVSTTGAIENLSSDILREGFGNIQIATFMNSCVGAQIKQIKLPPAAQSNVYRYMISFQSVVDHMVQ